MKFCMVTTFFGAHSFGGDAAYVDRLSRALLPARARGPRLPLRRRLQRRPGQPSAAAVHAAAGPARPPAREPASASLSPLATQMTGRPFFKAEALREALDAVDTDVVHFHNISLVGGPGVLEHGPAGRPADDGARALADLPDAPALEVRPEGLRRPRLRPLHAWPAAGRPRSGGTPGRSTAGLQQLDALIFPSRHTLEEHRRRGIGAPMVHLPYFLPDDWSGGIEDDEPEPRRPALPRRRRPARRR